MMAIFFTLTGVQLLVITMAIITANTTEGEEEQ